MLNANGYIKAEFSKEISYLLCLILYESAG